MWKFIIVYIFSMILVKRSTTLVVFCCKKKKTTMQGSHVKTFEFERVQLLLFFVCEKKKNYNAVVSRQNIRIRLLLFLFIP